MIFWMEFGGCHRQRGVGLCIIRVRDIIYLHLWIEVTLSIESKFVILH